MSLTLKLALSLLLAAQAARIEITAQLHVDILGTTTGTAAPAEGAGLL